MADAASPLLPGGDEPCERGLLRPVEGRVYQLLHRLGLTTPFERLLAYSPRARRLKEWSDDYPCLRAVVVLTYCMKGAIITGILLLTSSLRATPDQPNALASGNVTGRGDIQTVHAMLTEERREEESPLPYQRSHPQLWDASVVSRHQRAGGAANAVHGRFPEEHQREWKSEESMYNSGPSLLSDLRMSGTG